MVYSLGFSNRLSFCTLHLREILAQSHQQWLNSDAASHPHLNNLGITAAVHQIILLEILWARNRNPEGPFFTTRSCCSLICKC